MKNVLTVLAISFLMVFVSCSKDDTGNELTNEFQSFFKSESFTAIQQNFPKIVKHLDNTSFSVEVVNGMNLYSIDFSDQMQLNGGIYFVKEDDSYRTLVKKVNSTDDNNNSVDLLTVDNEPVFSYDLVENQYGEEVPSFKNSAQKGFGNCMLNCLNETYAECGGVTVCEAAGIIISQILIMQCGVICIFQ